MYLKTLATEYEKMLLEELDNHSKLALEIFGKTYYKKRAGFMLKDGTLLDLTQGGNPRDDHRSISAIYTDEELDKFETATDSLQAFVNEGNIRLIPEYPGLDLSVAPTEAQYEALLDYIQFFINTEKSFTVEISNQEGSYIAHETFRGLVPVQKVIDYIKYWLD